VTSREEQNALIDLQKLLASDLSKADRDTLIQGVRDSELVFDEAQTWTGRLVAELRRRSAESGDELSWPQLEKLTGVPKGTLIRRAKPFL
jgi:hypothetical protein